MKIKYDIQADAAYISFKKGKMQVTTIRLTEDVAVDLVPNEEIVGIKILDASDHLGLNIKHPKIKLENLIAA